MDIGIGFESTQHWHFHRAGLRHARQVVAQEVDDHHVFRPVLAARRQVGDERSIARRVGIATARALDGTRFHMRIDAAQEPLGR